MLIDTGACACMAGAQSAAAAPPAMPMARRRPRAVLVFVIVELQDGTPRSPRGRGSGQPLSPVIVMPSTSTSLDGTQNP